MGLKWMKKLHIKWMNMPYQMDGKMTYMDALGVRPPWYGPVVVIDISSGWTSHVNWMKNEANEHY